MSQPPPPDFDNVSLRPLSNIDIVRGWSYPAFMRDDLHKKAPIPRKAQNVFKLAGRPADRCHPERLRDAAIKALDHVVKHGLSRASFDAASGRTSQVELFGFGNGSQACSPTEAEFFRQMNSQPFGDPCAALEASLKSLSASYSREIRATMVAEGNVRDANAISCAFSEAFDSAATAVSSNICNGTPLPTAAGTLQLDENLLSNTPKKFGK